MKRFAALTGASAMAAAAALVFTAGAAHAQESPSACTYEALPIPEGLAFTFTTGMSDDGSIIAYRAYPLDPSSSYERYPLLYQDGQVTEVPIPGEDQGINAVNSAGTAVASGFVRGKETAYVWRDGKVSQLRMRDGGSAEDVNEAGDIVGYRGQRSASVAVIWPAGASRPVDLSMPANATSAMATSIDEDGTIVGYYEAAGTGDFKPYVWHPDGTGADLPMPEGVDPATAHAYTNEIDEGWVVGNLWAGDANPVGIRWNLNDGTVETLKTDAASSVNPTGWVSGDLYPNAVLLTGDARIELPGAVAPETNWFGDQGTSVSDDGLRVAGNVFAGENEYGHVLNAVVWTCE